jgi:hypothetical protein
MVDVVSKRCAAVGCTTLASYGGLGLSLSACAQHKKPGMSRKPRARCVLCKDLAIWGGLDGAAIRCELHKLGEDVNIMERKCGSCGLLGVLDKKDRCETCDPDAFKKARLAKQNAAFAYLDSRGLRGTQTDKMIDGGACGRERPDRVYETPEFILVVECDEHQHDDRPCLCEQTRMVNIGQAYGGTPVHFLRWNPDAYTPLQGREVALKKRHELLGDVVRDILGHRMPLPQGVLVSALYLFYDHFAGLDWITIG